MRRKPQVVVIGSLNVDLVQKVDRLPRAGETIVGDALEIFSGGKGANQAYAAGRMGARVSMIGQVGNDDLASSSLDNLRAAGVNIESVGVSDRSTGTAVIFVLPDGENVIIISPGANATMTPELAEERLKVLDKGAFLLLQLEIPIESVEESLVAAKTRGVTTILDPAPAVHKFTSESLHRVDFLTPNETEAMTLLGGSDFCIDDDAEVELIARRLLALGPRVVVLKLGSRGCLIAAEGGCHRVPGFKVKAIDTTAAGDVFNGAFTTALAEGQTISRAASFANAAAALSVTRFGAQNSVPSRQEVDRFLIGDTDRV
ncbi:MAG: ribokinase [Solibacterales bacterium]|nr:ribokinase [Bryobacterales bacterium]|tara:strand:+ start:3534 stop:4481 length:948 start_codon:yes stop_codon:yes gene_type:complete